MLLRLFTRVPGTLLSARIPGTPPLMAVRWASDAPRSATDGEKHIHNKLLQGLNPTKLTVTDSSGGCGSMYVVEVEAECFRDISRVKQTMMVNRLLKDELKDMHGMRVLCSVPPATKS
ncbi:hypothetical protein COEREDRAFT_81302 [Coemansia reversa NRRL 1564]|uniref:Bola-like protein n=1 Tax=Coemansia reversa (strain ATCC 12441 / NRRL 1564) TaxID=763665 RepID=A0A2G5BBE2_COERN|nr:hypothetical protein COEREDRAFT_81302 [Coemansia reversa NRRL 1564]|eukprot:PIA16326.1 hypothetical protein COEREDRAFT_81302 [Coemansia reversa NRRL 1564]